MAMLTLGLISFLFHPRAMQKKYATGRPDQKDLNENLAATQGLAHMITECNRLFEVEKSFSDATLTSPNVKIPDFYVAFVSPLTLIHLLDPS